MKGSFSRLPAAGDADLVVLLQQGRVLLDADWNLLAQVVDARLRALTCDLIGLDGTASSSDSLQIVPRGGLAFTDATGKALWIPDIGPMADAIARGDFTLEVIVKAGPDLVGTLIGSVGTTNTSLRLYVSPDHTLRFEIADRSIETPLPADDLHRHIAIVSERHIADTRGLSPVQQVWRLYLDGELITEAPPRDPPAQPPHIAGLLIGALGQPVTAGDGGQIRIRGQLRGAVAAVTAWTRALESAELRYSRSRWMRLPEDERAGRFAHWPLAEAAGDVAWADDLTHGLWVAWPATGAPEADVTHARAAWTPPAVALMPGRAYIGGLPAGLEVALPVDEQPDLPLVMPTAGRYVAYLEVFPAEYGDYDDPSIREVALGGADTAMHVRAIARTRLYAGSHADFNRDHVDHPAPKLRMSASWNGSGSALQNDLYRVEVACGGQTWREFPVMAQDDMSGLGTLAGTTFTFASVDPAALWVPINPIGASTERTSLLIAAPAAPDDPAPPPDPRTLAWQVGHMAMLVLEGSGDAPMIVYTAVAQVIVNANTVVAVKLDPAPVAIENAIAAAPPGARLVQRLFAAPTAARVTTAAPNGPATEVLLAAGRAEDWPTGQLIKILLGDDPTLDVVEPIVEQAVITATRLIAPTDPAAAPTLAITLSPTPERIDDYLANRASNPDLGEPLISIEAVAALRWAADNASTAFRAVPGGAQALRIVEQTGEGLRIGNWVEVVRQSERVGRLPARVYRVATVDDATDSVTLEGYSPTPDRAAWAAGDLYLRRWFSRAPIDPQTVPLGLLPLDVQNPIAIEQGITVLFERNRDGVVDVGDYWLIPTRTALPEGVDWPRRNNRPIPTPPVGPPVQRAALAELVWTDHALEITDLRRQVLTSTDAYAVNQDNQANLAQIPLSSVPALADVHQALAQVLGLPPSTGGNGNGNGGNGTGGNGTPPPPPPPPDPPPTLDAPAPYSPWRTSGTPEQSGVRARGAVVDGLLWVFTDDGRYFAWDPDRDIITARGALPPDSGSGPIATGFAVAAIDEMVYLVGGRVAQTGGTVLVSTVWAFDTTRSTFTRQPPVGLTTDQPLGTAGGALAAIDGTLYHFGGTRLATGQAPATTVTAQVLSWHPGATVWTDAGQLNQPRTEASAATLDGRAWIAGGRSDAPAQALADVETFRPAPGDRVTASTEQSLTAARVAPGLGVIGSQLYVVGGLGIDNTPLDTVEWIDTRKSDPFALLGAPGAPPASAAAAQALAFGGRIEPAVMGRPPTRVGTLTTAWLHVFGGQPDPITTLPGLMRPLPTDA